MNAGWCFDSVNPKSLNTIDITVCEIDDERIPILPHNVMTTVVPKDSTIG